MEAKSKRGLANETRGDAARRSLVYGSCSSSPVVGQASRLSGGRPALGDAEAGETPRATGETPAPLPEHLQSMHITYDALKQFAAEAFGRAGLSAEDAATGAEVLAMTDAWGVYTHGTKLLRGYLRRLKAGGLACEGAASLGCGGPGLGAGGREFLAGHGHIRLRDAGRHPQSAAVRHRLCRRAKQLPLRGRGLLRLAGGTGGAHRIKHGQRQAFRGGSRVARRDHRQQPDCLRRSGRQASRHLAGHVGCHGRRGQGLCRPDSRGEDSRHMACWGRWQTHHRSEWLPRGGRAAAGGGP